MIDEVCSTQGGPTPIGDPIAFPVKTPSPCSAPCGKDNRFLALKEEVSGDGAQVRE